MNNPFTLIALIIQKLFFSLSNDNTNEFIQDQHIDTFPIPVEFKKHQNKIKELEIKDKINMVRYKDLRARLYLSNEELDALNFKQEIPDS